MKLNRKIVKENKNLIECYFINVIVLMFSHWVRDLTAVIGGSHIES